MYYLFTFRRCFYIVADIKKLNYYYYNNIMMRTITKYIASTKIHRVCTTRSSKLLRLEDLGAQMRKASFTVVAYYVCNDKSNNFHHLCHHHKRKIINDCARNAGPAITNSLKFVWILDYLYSDNHSSYECNNIQEYLNDKEINKRFYLNLPI